MTIPCKSRPVQDDANDSSTSGTSNKQPSTKQTSPRRRQIRQQDQRSRSRFNPSTSRTRIRNQSRGQSAQTTTTPRPRPSFSRFRPSTLSSNTRDRFTSSGRRPSTSLFDYDDYDYDYDVELQSSQNSVPDAITVTHTVPMRTQIPVFENGRNTFRDILTTSPSLEVIAVTALKSTNIDGSPVIYANVRTDSPNLGTKVLTFEALRATETTAIEMTPTRIRGLRTSFSHVVPSTIYNIRPVTTSIVQEVDQNQVLTSLLLQLLGQQQQPQLGQQPIVQSTPALPALGLAPAPAPAPAPVFQSVPATQFITHTSTYVTTLTNVESTVLPITLRGREIKTTLVESKTEVVTATELSTETKIAPTAPALALQTAQNPGALGGLSPLSTLLPADLQQQLLVAQLQQQLLNQQLLSQVNLDQEGASLVEQTQLFEPRTSVVTLYVSGKNPGEFSTVLSTTTLTGAGENHGEQQRFKRDAAVNPSPVLPIEATPAPDLLSSGL